MKISIDVHPTIHNALDFAFVCHAIEGTLAALAREAVINGWEQFRGTRQTIHDKHGEEIGAVVVSDPVILGGA